MSKSGIEYDKESIESTISSIYTCIGEGDDPSYYEGVIIMLYERMKQLESYCSAISGDFS